MKQFRVFKISNMWSTNRLTKDVENELEKFSRDGYEIESISFGFNVWMIPTAFITVSRESLK